MPSSTSTPAPDRLRFSTTVLRLLGEELIPSPDQGILELIKNSYDADAKHCTVELKNVVSAGGTIALKDDGVGMTANEIRNGWLVVGDSMKSRRKRSPSGRLLVGSKGLGRLGALRLGTRVILTTRPQSEPKIQYRVAIDWTDFEKASMIEDVDLPVLQEAAPVGMAHGTEILISNIKTPWRESDIKRLARAILLLRDPFSNDGGFIATLKSSEYDNLVKLARDGYFSECAYHLIATIDKNGRASAEVRIQGGKPHFAGNHKSISSKSPGQYYDLPPLDFELWEFNLSPKSFAYSIKQTTVTAVKAWLQQFGGVRLYHRGVRVLPFGEPNNDWLDMNLRRAQHQELRPSTNNSIGRVRIDDTKGVFQQKTDRQGFIESHAFDELRQFAGDVLDWMAGQRIAERDNRIKSEAIQIQRIKKTSEKQVDDAIAKLPLSQRRELAAAVKQMKSAHNTEIELKDETAQLYFTLGTIGTTASAFAHQTKAPIRGILSDAKTLEECLGDPEELALHRHACSNAAKRIRREAGAIYSFSNVTLKLLEHEKRRPSKHSVNSLIDETIDLLSPYLKIRDTAIDRNYSDDNPYVWCRRAAFEAIMTNLITNSLQAFEIRSAEGIASDPRRIYIQTRVVGKFVLLHVQDNGPGIKKLSLDDIWLPGKTTTDKGTGLGLAIVKDVVHELQGTVKAEAHGEFGGAAFTITIPIRT